jgi:uncharacterized OB-fold protein
MPKMDDESRPYWEGLVAERLRIQRCLGCATHRFPALPGCPICGTAESEWVDASGTGRLYSWVTVVQAVSPEFADEVPYTVATVELDEGCRVLARLENVAEPHMDARLAVCFVHHEGWSEARFTELDP